MARRISSETRLKARLTATVIAMVLALASPVLIPMATATYNERFVPSSSEMIYTLTDQTVHPLITTAFNRSQSYNPTNEEIYWNSSVVVDLTGHSHYADPSGKSEWLLLGAVPPAYTIAGEDSLTVQVDAISQTFNNGPLPMFPTFWYNGQIVQIPKAYKYSYYAVYIGCDLDIANVTGESQVNAVLSVMKIDDPGMGTAVSMNQIRVGFLDTDHNQQYTRDQSNSYTKNLVISSNSISWNLTLSEAASIARDKIGSKLWIGIDLEPWVLYMDNSPYVYFKPFRLVVNLTATAIRGAYTIPYVETTNTGIGITGAIMFGCSAVIISNIPATRTYVHNRTKYRIVASSDLEVNEYAKERYLQNQGGG